MLKAHPRAQTTEEFYKSNTPSPKINPATGTPDWIGPAIIATETVLFVLGPEGIVLSAVLGLAFASLLPSKASKYNQTTRESILGGVLEGLRSNDMRRAIDDIRDFQEDLTKISLFAENMSNDDFRAVDVTVLDTLFKTVQAGGTLQRAFDTVCDGIRIDGHDHGNELQWLVAAVLSIFHAYWIRCTAYAYMARYYRRKNDFHGYNSHLSALRIAYEGCHIHLPILLKKAEGQINWAKQQRLSNITVEYDEFDTPWIDRTFGSADKERVRRAAFVKDGSSGQRLEVAGLVGRANGQDYSDGMGNKSDDNDKTLGEIGDSNKTNYIKHLTERLDGDIKPARDNWNKLQNLYNNFVERSKPATPQFAPVRVAKVHMGTPNKVPLGTKLSYRVVFVDSKGQPITASSPWSEWIKTSSQTELDQFLIGDGYAMTDTTRQIWMRVRTPSMVLFDIEGEKGVLVDTIRGHGLKLWPENSDHGSI
ncbi:hypothetical protein GGX14DRAFT_569716 [Mycena pura]|uniref:Uncharacterized protein n=1 Tax=Mycena pura TaxID=153505 RepID=A0AAD6V6S5_9AGAR|nr:hypothetical protein GGX14DRAFT_569716 [Mycena pura]